MNKLNKEITIIIATWNSQNYLTDLFSSLQNQSYQNFEIIIIDNGSKDQTTTWLEKNHSALKLIKNKENLGFCKAYNQGISLAKTPYVLVCNHDIILDQNFLAEVIKITKADSQIAAVGGKLFRLLPGLNNLSKSDTIDSTGIVFLKTRRAIERGESEKDIGQYEKLEEIFGIGAALVLYQKKALDQVSLQGEYFDEDFFAYKEDVDLAWRLRSAGYKAIYSPQAIAFHKRSTARKTDLTDQGTIVNRKTKNTLANYLSYRNHLFLLIKNESIDNLFFNHHVWWYEFKKIIYLFFREPATLIAWKDIFKNFKKMLRKRKEIKSKKKILNKELYAWFK